MSKRQRLEKIEASIPVVPFKGIEKFYDIGGLLADPEAMQLCVDVLIERYKDRLDAFTSIGCFDARGFLFAPILGLALKKKVFMLRKPGKMPSVAETYDYTKEYKGDNASGNDSLCIQHGAISPGDRVLLIDDLIATGGTVEAGIQLVKKCGGSVFECCFIIELLQLCARERIQKLDASISMWSVMSK